MLQLPTRIEENLAWIENRPWAFYRILPYSYTPMSVAEKEAQAVQSERFFKYIQESEYHAQLWLVNKRFNWDKYFERLVESAPKPHQEAAQDVMGGWKQIIDQGVLPDYEYILAVELPLPIAKKYRWLTQTFSIPARYVEWFLGFGGKTIFREEIDGGKDRERSIYDRIHKILSIAPLRPHEIADFYRHHFWRGMSMPALPERLRKIWPKGRQDYAWLAEGIVRGAIRHVEIGQMAREHWGPSRETFRKVAFIAVANPPSALDIPSHEIFYRVSELGFPVEATIRWKHIAPKKAMRMVRRKKMDVTDAVGHVDEVDSVPWSILEKQEIAASLEFHMQKVQPPLLESHIYFCVEAETDEELNSKCDDIITFLDDKGFVAARPTGEQEQLFNGWLPSSTWSGFGYKLELLPQVAGALAMPGASDLLGDPNGVPIGFSKRGAIVKVDPARGPQINKSASMVIVGPLGSGKSFLLNMLIHNTALIWGGKILIVDAKAERSHWPDVLPGLENEIRVLMLDGRRNPGALNPFRLLSHDLEAAAEVAVSMVGQMIQVGGREEELVLLSAAKVARQAKHPSMSVMLKAIQDSSDPNAKNIGEYLREIAELPLGKLIFGEGKEPPIPDSGIVILQLAGLTLPPANQPAETMRQRVSVAVMTATVLLAEAFVLHGKGGFRVAALDEAWTWLRTTEGKSLADRLERAGRSANAGIWISTQNPSDVSSDLLNNIGMYICLGAPDDDEAKLAISALGLQDTEELRKELQVRTSQVQDEEPDEQQTSGGYLRDLEGRAGYVQFYNPHPGLRAIFNTKPEAVAASKVYSSGGR